MPNHERHDVSAMGIVEVMVPWLGSDQHNYMIGSEIGRK